MLFTQVASIMVLAIALSLDSFGIGMTYGLRKVRIPWRSIIIISLCSGIVILLSMQLGNWLVLYISPAVAQWVGSIILIGIGCWALILRTPSVANRDLSGRISFLEAAWMGIALSLDAFGAGIGAALLGYPPLATAFIIAWFSGIFLRIGLQVGIVCAPFHWFGKLTFIPGIMLIWMGILKIPS